MNKLKTVVILMLGCLIIAGCGENKAAPKKTSNDLKSVIYVPKRLKSGETFEYELKYDKEKNVQEVIVRVTVVYEESNTAKEKLLEAVKQNKEHLEKKEGVQYSYKDGDKELEAVTKYNIKKALKSETSDSSESDNYFTKLANKEGKITLQKYEETLKESGYYIKGSKEISKKKNANDYEVKKGDTETLIKESGYSVNLGSHSASYTHVILENLEKKIVLDTIINEDGQVYEIKYSNREEGISDKDIYYLGTYRGQLEDVEAYTNSIRSMGITISTFYDFLTNYAVKNFPEAAPKRVDFEKVDAFKGDVGKALIKNNYIPYTEPGTGKYFKLKLTDVETGIVIETTTQEDSILEIKYTNFDEGISQDVYYNGKHKGEDEGLDLYLATIKKIGFNEEQFFDFLKNYRSQYLALMPGGAEKASESSTTTQSSTTESTKQSETNDTSSTDVKEAIKKVDAQYDKMIEKAQGYVDKPETYTDAASIEFLADYNELMIEYAKLGETMNAGGNSTADSDILTVYTNMLTKSAKLGELYGKLGEK